MSPKVIFWTAAVAILIAAWINDSASNALAWTFLCVVVGIMIAIIWIKNWSEHRQDEDRRQHLMNLYNDEEIVDRIIEKIIWNGETEDQVRQSLGDPESVDQAVLKGKKSEVWKYYQYAKGRFHLRVTLEDAFVVGWEKKGDD